MEIPCRSANRLSKKRKEKEILEKGPDFSVMIYRGEINLYVSSRITQCIMSTSRVVVKFSQKSLANFLRGSTGACGEASRSL
jgi:hypothetical protein